MSFDVERGLVSNQSINGKYLFSPYVNTLFLEKAKQDILKAGLEKLMEKAKQDTLKQNLDAEILQKALDDIKKMTNGYNPAYRETIKLFLNSVTGKFVENIDLYEDNVYTITPTKKTINDNYTQTEGKKKQLNQYMGCGAMIYSYSKQLLF